jgi:hypothetical protein
MKYVRAFAMTVTVSTLGMCLQVSAAEPALEPAVDTSATPAPAAATAPTSPATSPPAAPTATKAPVPPEKAPAPTTATPAGQSATPATRGAGRAQDRLELDATQITGNSELPRVLYVVPWKRSDLGDLTGRPVNSLLDEVLAPVDRDVFRRQNRYYDALHPDTAPGGSGGVAAEVEK